MLIIVTEHHKLNWTIGNPGPMQYNQQTGLASGNQRVLEVIADGDELDYIRQRFTNIPMAIVVPGPPSSDFVVWRGDIAQFIADNCNE